MTVPSQKIENVTVLTKDGFRSDVVLLINNGKIAYVGPDHGTIAEHIVDGRGAKLVPGFIDLHVHGGAGYDFMDATPEAVEAICRFHAKHGTTSLLATTMTAPLEQILELIKFYRQLPSLRGGASVLGLHLEGPFINERFKGAQNAEHIAQPTNINVERVLEAAGPALVKMITLAPELVEDERVFSVLQEREMIVSAGHTGIDYRGGCSCLRRGVSHVTHLGNAMAGFHHRNPGLIGLVMEQSELSFDIIADGIHLAPEFIRLLTRICSVQQMMLITDAMRACGLKDGMYELGGQQVIVTGDEARLVNGALAGSLLTLDRAVANMLRFTDLTLEQAIRLVTSNQAEKLGISDRKGTIEQGKDADLVLLDDHLNVLDTWVMGEKINRELNTL